MPIWNVIRNSAPDVLALIGDNIYADEQNKLDPRDAYAQLAANPDFAAARESLKIIATWDDHDFGLDDGGREHSEKAERKDLMLNFFGEPANSERRKREGVYTSYFFGSHPHRVQVILLDLRWFRSPLNGPNDDYSPNPDPTAVMLGEEQWEWLENQFQMPADARIIASSVQFVSSIHKWEKWSNFPYEKARMVALIDKYKLQNFVFISGDMHFAELSKEVSPEGREIFDLTSSGLNNFESAEGIYNPNRLALFDQDNNFGLITIDWDKMNMQLEARNSRGQRVLGVSLCLKSSGIA